MEIVIRQAQPEEADSFLTLLQKVREGMTHKEWFYLDPPELVREQLKNGRMKLWFALDRDQLAGAFSCVVPGLESDNYGYELGFTQAQLMQVVNMDSVAVHPNYRGLGLQKRLIQTAEASLKRRGDCILLCTVHPDNTYSLRNMMALGYSVQRQCNLYGSVRCILRKDFL